METPSTTSIGLKYGLIFGMISIIYSISMYASGLMLNTSMGAVNGIVGLGLMIAGFVLAFREFKAATNGFMEFKEGLMICFLMSLILCSVSGLFTYVLYKFIDPELLTSMEELIRQQYEAANMSDEQIEQALEMSKFFRTPEFMLASALIGGLFFHMIVGLITTAAMKKTKPMFE
jgi:Protein of unknown function (DUF4199)